MADDHERDYALCALAARGLDREGRESEGAYHADVYLSRPPADVADHPLDALFASLP